MDIRDPRPLHKRFDPWRRPERSYWPYGHGVWTSGDFNPLQVLRRSHYIILSHCIAIGSMHIVGPFIDVAGQAFCASYPTPTSLEPTLELTPGKLLVRYTECVIC